MRWRTLALTCALTLGGGAGAMTPPDPSVPAAAPREHAPETIAYGHDAARRMTVPVSLGDHGPFPFVVDTGAERTVISRELADALQLDASRNVLLTSIVDVRTVPTVIIPRLDLGRRSHAGIQAPALARQNIGAEGMLGVDTLQNQQVIFDFQRRELTLSRSHLDDENWPADTIVIRARSRYGRLVLANANVDGQRVYAIVDTGSPVTIGNHALRRRLERSGRIDPNQVLQLTGVTGASVQVNYTRTRRIRLGDTRIHDMPIAFSDLALFRQLELLDRPAILLGMDALQLFQRISIDFASRRVRLLPGPTSQAGSLMMAAR